MSSLLRIMTLARGVSIIIPLLPIITIITNYYVFESGQLPDGHVHLRRARASGCHFPKAPPSESQWRPPSHSPMYIRVSTSSALPCFKLFLQSLFHPDTPTRGRLEPSQRFFIPSPTPHPPHPCVPSLSPFLHSLPHLPNCCLQAPPPARKSRYVRVTHPLPLPLFSPRCPLVTSVSFL